MHILLFPLYVCIIQLEHGSITPVHERRIITIVWLLLLQVAFHIIDFTYKCSFVIINLKTRC